MPCEIRKRYAQIMTMILFGHHIFALRHLYTLAMSCYVICHIQGNHCVEQSLFEFATSAVSFLSSALVGYGEKSAVRCSSTATHVFYIEGWRSVTSMASRWVDSSNNKKTSGRFQECQQLKKQKVLTKFSDHTNYTNLIQSIYQHETKTPTIN